MRPTSVCIESIKNAVLLASYGAFATGSNVKRLHHIVLASPSKSRVRVLQSIGRGLRLHITKRVIYIMDLVDDAHTDYRDNYAYTHWGERAKFYQDENFPVEMYSHTIQDAPHDAAGPQ